MIRSLKKNHKIFLPNGPCPLPGCLGMAFTPTRLCQGPQVSRSRPCAANLFVCPNSHRDRRRQGDSSLLTRGGRRWSGAAVAGGGAAGGQFVDGLPSEDL